MKSKIITILMALVLCMSVLFIPALAYTGAETEPTAKDTTESAIPSDVFTPDGTGTVVDNLTSDSGKEFFSIESVDGYIYYLIVDRQRESENVYFLNAVTESDLLGLAQKGDGTTTSVIPTIPEPEPEQPEPTPTPEADTENAPDNAPTVQTGMSSGTIIFIVVAVIATGGAGYYFKIYLPKQQGTDIEEEDYDETEDENEDDYDSMNE